MATIHDNSAQQPQEIVKTYTAEQVRLLRAQDREIWDKAGREFAQQEYQRGYEEGKKAASASAPEGSRTMRFNRSFAGQTIVIENGKMLVNGQPFTEDDFGNVMGYVDDIQITGDVGNIKTMSGSVTVHGDVKGDARTMSGSIHCHNVYGRASTMSGSIYKN